MNSNDTQDGVVEDVDLEWFEELLKDCILMCMLIFCNTLCVCTKRLDNGPQLFKICIFSLANTSLFLFFSLSFKFSSFMF